MHNLRTHTLMVALLGVAMGALLGGCRTYHNFEDARAQSAGVRTALADQGQTIEDDDTDAFRRERFRYIQHVQGLAVEADEIRLKAMRRKMSSHDAKVIAAAMEIMYGHLTTLASMPARLKEDGTPADEATAEMLEQAGDAMAGLGGR